MHKPYHSRRNQHDYTTNNNKRRPIQRSPPTIDVFDGEVVYRIVCHASVIGGLFAGGVISDICRDTNCRIYCEEVVPGSAHRVVLVIGPGFVDRTIVFFEEEESVREECGVVSSSQEAVIRVCERMWEVEVQLWGDDVAGCGLLANTMKIGLVVGKGGKRVMKIRKDSGAKIRMLAPPSCAAVDDELIQITGGTLAVKKALVAITACLQDPPPMAQEPVVERVNHDYYPDPHTEYFPNLRLPLPPVSGVSVTGAAAPQFHSSSTDADDNNNLNPDMKGTRREVSFRLLCSNKAAGGIIGRKGAIVKDLQNDSGASITFSAKVDGSGERLATISADENLDEQNSPAQIAVLLVFARSVQAENQQSFSSGLSEKDIVTAKLLIGSELISCLTDHEGNVLFELSDAADIDILEEECVLECAAENDVIVQITGTLKEVQDALFLVTGRLRQRLFSEEVHDEVTVRRPRRRVGKSKHPGFQKSVPLSSDSEQETISGGGIDSGPHNIWKGMGRLGLSDNIGGASKSKPSKRRGGTTTIKTITDGESDSTTFTGGLERESGNESFFVANATVEIVVAEHVFDALFGEDGENLAHVKQISGANVDVQDPCPGKTGRTIVISGTPDQTMVAQSLLHAFKK